MIERFAKRWPGTTAVLFGLALGIFCILTGIGLAWVLDQVGIF